MVQYLNFRFMLVKPILTCILNLLLFVWSFSVVANPVLKSVKVNVPPEIDGQATDSAWSGAPSITTHDKVADIDIKISSVYDQDNVYMLVSFADETEDRQHKIMHWNEDKQRYITGLEREDSFVFKWNMLSSVIDISLLAEISYKADIWYWKSMRTDHAGFADDKMHFYDFKKSKNARLLISKNGSYFYLSRKGDQGSSAYSPAFYMDKKAQTMPKYNFVIPTGSRADVKAKGNWKEGVWTIEFQRALTTGHEDDVQFDTALPYYFGVSRYEIAGRKPDKNIGQPNFGSGEINQLIELNFIQE